MPEKYVVKQLLTGLATEVEFIPEKDADSSIVSGFKNAMNLFLKKNKSNYRLKEIKLTVGKKRNTLKKVEAFPLKAEMTFVSRGGATRKVVDYPLMLVDKRRVYILPRLGIFEKDISNSYSIEHFDSEIIDKAMETFSHLPKAIVFKGAMVKAFGKRYNTEASSLRKLEDKFVEAIYSLSQNVPAFIIGKDAYGFVEAQIKEGEMRAVTYLKKDNETKVIPLAFGAKIIKVSELLGYPLENTNSKKEVMTIVSLYTEEKFYTPVFSTYGELPEWLFEISRLIATKRIPVLRENGVKLPIGDQTIISTPNTTNPRDVNVARIIKAVKGILGVPQYVRLTDTMYMAFVVYKATEDKIYIAYRIVKLTDNKTMEGRSVKQLDTLLYVKGVKTSKVLTIGGKEVDVKIVTDNNHIPLEVHLNGKKVAFEFVETNDYFHPNVIIIRMKKGYIGITTSGSFIAIRDGEEFGKPTLTKIYYARSQMADYNYSNNKIESIVHTGSEYVPVGWARETLVGTTVVVGEDKSYHGIVYDQRTWAVKVLSDAIYKLLHSKKVRKLLDNIKNDPAFKPKILSPRDVCDNKFPVKGRGMTYDTEEYILPKQTRSKLIRAIKSVASDYKEFEFEGDYVPRYLLKNDNDPFPHTIGSYNTVNYGTLSSFVDGETYANDWVMVYEYFSDGDAHVPSYYYALYVPEKDLKKVKKVIKEILGAEYCTEKEFKRKN